MIQSITIRNLLSHKNSKLEFVSGVNVIVGETKAGKSAIMEAIDWVKDNRPTGNIIRSNWGGTTSVSLNLDDHRVQRIKSDKLNQYRLDKMEPFRSIKTDVPVEIKKALNLNEINVESQFEPHFLLSSSPGEVAQHFNKIAHLEQISVAEKRVKSWIGKINSDIESGRANEKRLEANLIEFEYLDEVEEKLQNLEEKEALLENLEKDIDSIDSLIENIESVQQEIDEQSEIIKAEEKVNELINLTEKRDKLEEEIESIDWYVDAIEDCQQDIEENKAIVSAEKKVDELIGLGEKKKKLNENIKNMGSLIDSIEITTEDKKEYEKELKQLQEKWNKFAGDVCPLCSGKGKIEKL